jgi:3-oxoacyl-[acyl-carrier-protein] synthase II
VGERRRAVITGMGTVNACTAGGTEAVASALALGSSGIRPVGAFAVEGSRSRLAALVEDATLAALIDRDQARRLSRICQLAVAACLLAVRDSGVNGGTGLAIVVGSEHGDFRSSAEFADGFLRRGPAGLSPMIFPNTVMNTMASVAAIAVGAKAPSITLNQPTLAGDLAIARAVALIRAGRAEAVLAGGVDEVYEPVYRRLALMRALSPSGGDGVEGCFPYAPAHNGAVLGEGATFLVVEDLDAARARGAAILAEVVGAAWATVPVRPHGAGPARLDRGSPVGRLLRSRLADGTLPLGRCYGSGNGDPLLDDWEEALLADDLSVRGATGLLPPVSLAPLFGQHAGLGALRAGAAALDASRGLGPVLVHGIARGGCRTALIMAAPDPGHPA